MLEAAKSYYSLNPNIILHKVEGLDKYWAFNTADGGQFELNATAYWLLEHLDGKHSLEDVLNQFSNEFDVEGSQYKSDIMEIIGDFIKQAIII